MFSDMTCYRQIYWKDVQEEKATDNKKYQWWWWRSFPTDLGPLRQSSFPLGACSRREWNQTELAYAPVDRMSGSTNSQRAQRL